jgi:hypothetical protein
MPKKHQAIKHMKILKDKGFLLAAGVTLAVCGLLLFAEPVLAAHGLDTAAAEAGFEGTETNLSVIIGRIIQALIGFVGVIILILMLYAGFLWMTAAGNEERVASAKKIIIGAMAGAVIVIGAYAITSFIVDVVQPGEEGTTTVDDTEFVETEDPLEEALTPEDLDTLLDEAGIGEAGDDSELLD